MLGILRQLSCLLVSKADLEQTGVAFSVRKLRKSNHEEVQRIASNLIEKWKKVVMTEKPAQHRQTDQHTLQPQPVWQEKAAQQRRAVQQTLQLRPSCNLEEPIILT